MVRLPCAPLEVVSVAILVSMPGMHAEKSLLMGVNPHILGWQERGAGNWLIVSIRRGRKVHPAEEQCPRHYKALRLRRGCASSS